MKVVVQRVKEGGVSIIHPPYSAEIRKGFVILLGIHHSDTKVDAEYLAEKCAALRVFEDANDKMNLSLTDVNGEVLVISQFTLYADARRGNRPNFSEAARPETAIPLYEHFIAHLKSIIGDEKVKTGIFGAMMEVTIINDGPVTIIIESRRN